MQRTIQRSSLCCTQIYCQNAKLQFYSHRQSPLMGRHWLRHSVLVFPASIRINILLWQSKKCFRTGISFLKHPPSRLEWNSCHTFNSVQKPFSPSATVTHISSCCSQSAMTNVSQLTPVYFLHPFSHNNLLVGSNSSRTVNQIAIFLTLFWITFKIVNILKSWPVSVVYCGFCNMSITLESHQEEISSRLIWTGGMIIATNRFFKVLT